MKTTSLRVLLGAFLLFASVSLFTACKSGPKDADLTATLQQKLSTISGVSVAVKDGVATLSGEVKDDAAKATAESEAKAVEGVKSVVNNLTVTPPPPPAAVVISPDDTLTKSVTDAIKDYSGVKAEVKDGVVTLTGEIKRTSLPKLMMAVQASKPKKVENKLTIK